VEPPNVLDQLTVLGGAGPVGVGVELLAAVVRTFDGLIDGEATLVDVRLTVSGTALDPAGAVAVNGAIDAAQDAGLATSGTVEPAPPPSTGGVVTIVTSTASTATDGGAQALGAAVAQPVGDDLVGRGVPVNRRIESWVVRSGA
jgi:hypothetical protein